MRIDVTSSYFIWKIILLHLLFQSNPQKGKVNLDKPNFQSTEIISIKFGQIITNLMFV